MCRTWSGARGSGRSSPGSISPSSVRTDVPCKNAVSWLESLVFTSWDCSSSTQRRPMFSPASGETQSTLRSTSRRACRTVGPWDTRRLEHAALRHLIAYGPEPLLMLTAFEVLDAEEQERLERDLIDLIDRYNRRETMVLPSITWGCSEAEQ